MRGTNKRGTNPRNAQGKFCKSKEIEKCIWCFQQPEEYRQKQKDFVCGACFETMQKKIDEIIDLLNEHDKQLLHFQSDIWSLRGDIADIEARLKKLETPFWITTNGVTTHYSTTAPDTKKECEQTTEEFVKWVSLFQKWFKDEDMEVSDYVCGRMASRIQSELGKRI